MSWAHPETSSRKTLWNIDSGLSKFTRSCAHPQASWGQKRAERASGVTTVLGLLRCWLTTQRRTQLLPHADMASPCVRVGTDDSWSLTSKNEQDAG